MREFTQSTKLASVRYDVRGPILREAQHLEAEGHKIIKLNIGNTAPFGLHAPPALLADMARSLPESDGYSDSRGIVPAREAVADHYGDRGFPALSAEDVWIGNGVSELISMTLQAFVDAGDEVLVPMPDYPLWTGATRLAGGTPVHYRCDEECGWEPDLADVAAKITPATRALVVINPNNPTGAVYSPATVRGLVELARRHDLMVLTDEIYEQITFDEAVHHHAAVEAGEDVLCLTFSGLSKAYRSCGFRAGWLVVTGPRERAANFVEGLDLLANMRMCANVPGQHAVRAALCGDEGLSGLTVPGGRLYEQSVIASDALNEIPGITCVRPRGALYCFPRLDTAVHPVRDDEALALDILRSQHVLVTHGRGFNWKSPDHFRLTFLPPAPVLTEAIGRLGEYFDAARTGKHELP